MVHAHAQPDSASDVRRYVSSLISIPIPISIRLPSLSTTDGVVSVTIAFERVNASLHHTYEGLKSPYWNANMRAFMYRICITIVNIFFPPLAVAMLCGLDHDCMINCFLFLLAVIPSHVHGFYISCTYFHRRKKVGSSQVTHDGKGCS